MFTALKTPKESIDARCAVFITFQWMIPFVQVIAGRIFALTAGELMQNAKNVIPQKAAQEPHQQVQGLHGQVCQAQVHLRKVR